LTDEWAGEYTAQAGNVARFTSLITPPLQGPVLHAVVNRACSSEWRSSTVAFAKLRMAAPFDS